MNQSLKFTHIFQMLEDTSHQKLVSSFSCGVDSIDNFIRNDALDSEYITNTFTLWRPDALIGFVTLQNDATSITRKYRVAHEFKVGGITEYPSLLISFLGVDSRYQGQQFGASILSSILAMAYEQRYALGAFTIVSVESLPQTIPFYERFSFQQYTSPNGNTNKYLGITMDEIQDLLKGMGEARTQNGKDAI